ncbi:MAG: hypothetical protein IJE08_01225 [Clostridia bacterium]|nr:hypothetical protein [Clostridia bacterium]
MPGGGSLFGIIISALCALALVALEAFIPGISLAGIAGAGIFVFSLYLCWTTYGPAWAIALALFFAAGAFFVTKFVVRSIKKGRLSGIFMNEPSAPVKQNIKLAVSVQVGMVGTTKSALRPSGIAEMAGERVHVTADKGFIEQNVEIRVVRIEGARIFVAPA